MSVFAKYENKLSIVGGLRPLIIFANSFDVQ